MLTTDNYRLEASIPRATLCISEVESSIRNRNFFNCVPTGGAKTYVGLEFSETEKVPANEELSSLFSFKSNIVEVA